MEGLGRAIEAGAIAGKMRAAAMDYRAKADALDRAADAYSRGAGNALAQMLAGDWRRTASRPASPWGLGSQELANRE